MVLSAGNQEQQRSFISQLSTARVGIPCAVLLFALTMFFIRSDLLYRSMPSPLHLVWIGVHAVAAVAVVIVTKVAFRHMPASDNPAQSKRPWKLLLLGQLIMIASVIWLAATHVTETSPRSIQQFTLQTMPLLRPFAIGIIALMASLIVSTLGIRALFAGLAMSHSAGKQRDRVDSTFLIISGLAFTASLFLASPPHFVEIDHNTYWVLRGVVGAILVAAIFVPARIALALRAQIIPHFGPILAMQVLHVFLVASVTQNWPAHPFGLAMAMGYVLAISRVYRIASGQRVTTLRLHAFFPEILGSLAVGGIVIASWHQNLLIDSRVESVLLGGVSAGILVFGLLRYTRLEVRQYRNVGELIGIVHEVHRESRQDALTRLGNRSALQEDLENIMLEANVDSSDDRAVTLFFIDLDYFKRINDSLGHHVGDELLQIIAQRLRTAFGPDVYRLGGDEFVALRTDLSPDQIQAFMTDALEVLTKPVDLAGTSLNPSFSVGIARSEQRHDRGAQSGGQIHDITLKSQSGQRHGVHNFWSDARHPDGPKRILQRADLALYRAKELGRGQFVEYDPSFRQHVRQRREHMVVLRSVVADRSLQLVSEPATRAGTHEVCGELHTVSLDVDGSTWKWPYLHSLALEDGFLHELFITKISLLADYAACSEPILWHGIELSRQELTHPELIAVLQQLWDKHHLERKQLRILVSERLMQDQTCRSTMQALITIGFDVCVSDFGTAPSSILDFAEYPATSVLWSAQMIEQLGRSETTTDVISVVGNLAESLSLEWGAVGVTEAFQAAALAEMNSSFISGSWVTEELATLGVSNSNEVKAGAVRI